MTLAPRKTVVFFTGTLMEILKRRVSVTGSGLPAQISASHLHIVFYCVCAANLMSGFSSVEMILGACYK